MNKTTLEPVDLHRMAKDFRSLADDAERLAGKPSADIDAFLSAARAMLGLLPQSYARQIVKARKMLTEFFHPSLFADPARDILLDLFIAAEDGKSISTTSCCVAAEVPATTALRWIERLERDGLLRSMPDHRDGRRRMLTLTPAAHDAMRRYLTAILAMQAAQMWHLTPEATPSCTCDATSEVRIWRTGSSP